MKPLKPQAEITLTPDVLARIERNVDKMFPLPAPAPAPAPATEPQKEESPPAEAHVRISPETELLTRLSTVARKRGQELVEEIAPTSANVATILHMHPAWRGVVAYDEFAQRVVTTSTPPWHELDAPAALRPGPWSDADTTRLQHWLERTPIAGCDPVSVKSRETVASAVTVAAEKNAYHPVRAYLQSLRWDGIPRVNALASVYLGAEDTSYARGVSSCLLIGAVARVLRPGCKLDTVVVLEGDQGAGKSSAIKVLAGEWFSDSKIDIGSKDAYQALRGVWMVELGELASLKRADVETIKAFVSSSTDRYRPSFGRFEVDAPRQCVFVGTTNDETYTHDATGGRRWHPLRTGTIDLEALDRDRDQLWAEAVARYRAGEPWWLTGDAAKEAEDEASQRYVDHPWTVNVATYLESPTRREHGVTVEDVLSMACGIDIAHRTQAMSNEVVKILRRLGWARKKIREGEKRQWRYLHISHRLRSTERLGPLGPTGT